MLSACAFNVKRNKDFEYMKNESILKITIQSVRDKTYKLVVKDSTVIKEIYDILSTSEETSTVSKADPDYVIEIYKSEDEVESFNYAIGIDKDSGANFYNDNKKYIVSDRLDNDIVKNFSDITKPVQFESMYYDTLYKVMETYLSKHKDEKPKIGIDICNDLYVKKYQLYSDINSFATKVAKKDAGLLEGDKKESDFDVVMRVKTDGYTSSVYKMIITFENVKEPGKVQETLYVANSYNQGIWSKNITEEKPEGF